MSGGTSQSSGVGFGQLQYYCYLFIFQVPAMDVFKCLLFGDDVDSFRMGANFRLLQQENVSLMTDVKEG